MSMRRPNTATANSASNGEPIKLKRSFHRHFRRSIKNVDTKSNQWRAAVQYEVDKLYRYMVELQQSKLVGKEGENPEEAIFGVLCLIGDCGLVDKWLFHHSKQISFYFQLYNYCECIEEWLVDLSQLGNRGDVQNMVIQPATCQALASCLLERVFAERLECCTVVHLAAMSGDANMVIAVQTIWDEVVRDMIRVTQAQLKHRSDDETFKVRLQVLEGEWRCHNSLQETPYDLVPDCTVIGNKKRCHCSASFNNVQCSALRARRALLAGTEVPAPLFFSGIFAMIVVVIIMAIVSIHSQPSDHSPEYFTAAEWGGIAFSYILLWTVLALSSFVRHLWNVLTLGLVLLELKPAPPSNCTPPTAVSVASIKKRRLSFRVEKLLATVMSTDAPSDHDLNSLERLLAEAHIGNDQKPTFVIDEDLIKRAYDLLLSRREAQRRVKEIAHMRKVAGKLLANLGELEVDLRTRVDTQISIILPSSVQVELLRTEQFIKDPRLKDEEDVMRVSMNFARVKELMKLRIRLEEVLGDPRDEVFEHVVMRCREARIQESRVVKDRLFAIEQPRQVNTQLKAAIAAPLLDSFELQRATNGANHCLHRPDIVALVEKAKLLRNALIVLEQAQSNGRKAHAQLLVSADHDISHIDRLATELSIFEQTCQEVRGDHQLPSNITNIKDLLQKWKREQGPSRKLKAAVSGTDCSALRAAIVEAKEAGIGIKAARKRLSALEHKDKVKVQLAAAVKGSDINLLREVVAVARQVGINVDDEKEVLKKLVQIEECKEKLALAQKSNREDKLQAAVAFGRELDIDCTEAQHQLEALMEKRLTEKLLEEEARAHQRQQCMTDLDNLLEDPDCSAIELVDAMRIAKVVGADIRHALKILTERISREIHKAMNPIDNDNDPKVLSDALRCASLVNGFGATVDITMARERLEEWHKQERTKKHLDSVIATVENCADARTMNSLEEGIKLAIPIFGEESESILKAQSVLVEAHALMDLGDAERSCRVAHEQACMMMHRRYDKIEKIVPEYINAFIRVLQEAEGTVSDSKIKKMRDMVDVWSIEAKLIYKLRTAVVDHDIAALTKAIQDAESNFKAINTEPPKRILDKLNKEAENESLRAQIEEALNQDAHDCAMLSAAIDAAKAAGLPTYDATVVLVKWTNEGRNALSRARASRNKNSLREALESTAAMGLGGLPEWTDAKRALEGGRNQNVQGTKSASSKFNSSRVDHEMGPRHRRWKTEICSHWLMHGTCSYGKERCNFAHGEDDLRKPNDSASVLDENRSKSESDRKLPQIGLGAPKQLDIHAASAWSINTKLNRKLGSSHRSHSPDTSDTHSEASYSSKPSDSGKLWSSVAQEPDVLTMPYGHDTLTSFNSSNGDDYIGFGSEDSIPRFGDQQWLTRADYPPSQVEERFPKDDHYLSDIHKDDKWNSRHWKSASLEQDSSKTELDDRFVYPSQQQNQGAYPNRNHNLLDTGSSDIQTDSFHMATSNADQQNLYLGQSGAPWSGGKTFSQVDWGGQDLVKPTSTNQLGSLLEQQWGNTASSASSDFPINRTDVAGKFNSIVTSTRTVITDDADFENVDGDRFYDAVVGRHVGPRQSDTQEELVSDVLGNVMDDDVQANTLRSVLDFMD